MLVSLRCGHARAIIYVSRLSSPKTRKALTQILPTRAKARVAEGKVMLIELDLRAAPEGHRYALCAGEVAYWPPASALIVALYEGCREMVSPLNYLGYIVEGFEALKSLSGVFEVELRLSDREDVKRSFIDSEE